MTLPQPAGPDLARSIDLEPYDGVLLVSFGGPESPDDVIPFLQNVTRGRAIPRARLDEVAEHYLALGGRSPINDQNRALLVALRAELDRRGGTVPVYWGNRNWHPFLADELRRAHTSGARRLLAVLTSAYSSYSSCRQYREDLAAALTTLAGEGRELAVDKVRQYFNHPGFVAAVAGAVRAGLATLPDGARLVFVTHSLPDRMAATAGPDGDAYQRQHLDVAATVAARMDAERGPAAEQVGWDLVYCSRSGPPDQPWLEPDVCDHLAALAARGVPGALVVPLGFVSDHMEVVYDLDTEARAAAELAGLPFARAATPGTAPAFVAGLVDLLAERAAAERAAGAGGSRPGRATVGRLPAAADSCPAGCCPNPRRPLPAACGAGWTLPAVTR